MGSPMTEKRRAGIAKVKELWRQKGKGGNVDKKAWTIFLSSGRSFEELFLGDSSDSSSDDNSHHDQYWDPAWMKDENEERNRRRWEREESQREQEWRRKQEERKRAEREAFMLWSKRWDERNLALRQGRTPRGRSAPKPAKNGSDEQPVLATFTGDRRNEKTDEKTKKKQGKNESEGDNDESGERESTRAKLYFMFGESSAEEEESEDERREQREWAEEIQAAEQRMEQGQSVVASSFKRRREQFYENRRSTSDLSSGEIDLVDDAQSTSASHASHVTCTSTTPAGKSLLLGHQTLVTSGKPTGGGEELESTKGTREKGSSAARKTPTKDGDEKGLSKKVKKGSFRMPSFRRKSEAQPPPTPLPTAARAAEASVRQSRGSAIFGRRQAGGDKVQLQHRFRLRRVLSSDHLPVQEASAT